MNLGLFLLNNYSHAKSFFASNGPLGSKPYFFKRRIQCDWSSSCSLFIIFFMTMKSRGFVGPDLLRTFFPPKPSYDLWKNDCAIACFLGVVYKQKSIEKYVLDLDFLVERHKLDMKQQKESSSYQTDGLF